MSPKRITLRDAPCKPGLHLVLNPADRMRSDFHPHRELTFRLQLVDLRLFQPSTLDDLCKPQYMDWRAVHVSDVDDSGRTSPSPEFDCLRRDLIVRVVSWHLVISLD